MNKITSKELSKMNSAKGRQTSYFRLKETSFWELKPKLEMKIIVSFARKKSDFRELSNTMKIILVLLRI